MTRLTASRTARNLTPRRVKSRIRGRTRPILLTCPNPSHGGGPTCLAWTACERSQSPPWFCSIWTPSWLPGGFLGVDVFFVVSGFLITQLLLRELRDSGRLALGAFYLRRARRLLPAVLVVIAVVVVAGLLFWPEERETLWESALSSLAYVTNWWLIFDDQSYFEFTGQPPLLQHLWSLSIEEQYYLLWPCAILAVVCWGRSVSGGALTAARARRLAVIAFGLALVSTVLMAVIAVSSGVPYEADSARVYFGTDTHATGLLLGSAVGAWAVSNDQRRRRSILTTRAWDLLALLALALVIWQLRRVDEFDPGLYRGGFLAFDALVVLVVFAVTRRGSALGRALDRPIPRWVGLRSYSIYLWHWPVVVLTMSRLDAYGSQWLLQALRVALILVLAELSYRWVEQRFRSHQPAADRGRGRRQPSRAVHSGVLIGVAGTAVVFMSVSSAPTRVAPAEAAPPADQVTVVSQPPPSAASPAFASAPAPAAPPQVSAYGDSVLLGAQGALQASGTSITVSAAQGIQAHQMLDAVAAAAAAQQLGSVVVIHTGNNGIINPSQLASTLDVLRDRQRVVLVNVRVPRNWESPNNQTISNVGSSYPNVTVVDWHSITGEHPDWLHRDGIHVTRDGAAGYATLVLSGAA